MCLKLKDDWTLSYQKKKKKMIELYGVKEAVNVVVRQNSTIFG